MLMLTGGPMDEDDVMALVPVGWGADSQSLFESLERHLRLSRDSPVQRSIAGLLVISPRRVVQAVWEVSRDDRSVAMHTAQCRSSFAQAGKMRAVGSLDPHATLQVAKHVLTAPGPAPACGLQLCRASLASLEERFRHDNLLAEAKQHWQQLYEQQNGAGLGAAGAAAAAVDPLYDLQQKRQASRKGTTAPYAAFVVALALCRQGPPRGFEALAASMVLN